MESISLFDVSEFEKPKKRKLDNSLTFYPEIFLNQYALKKNDYIEFYFCNEKDSIVGTIELLGIQYKKSEIDFYILMIKSNDGSTCSYGCSEKNIKIIKHISN